MAETVNVERHNRVLRLYPGTINFYPVHVDSELAVYRGPPAVLRVAVLPSVRLVDEKLRLSVAAGSVHHTESVLTEGSPRVVDVGRLDNLK